MKVPVCQEEVTVEWFQSVFDEAGEHVAVETVEVEPATKPGDNFAAEVLRASVNGSKDGETWSASYILKIVPVPEFIKKMLLETKIFDQEVESYNRILPDMVRLQEGQEKVLPDTPKCLLAKMEGLNGVIVLEDLKPQGYVLYDRRKAHDLEHCKLVMKALAKFHALGYKCKYSSQVPLTDTYPNLKHFFFDIARSVFCQFRNNALLCIHAILDNGTEMEKNASLFKEKGNSIMDKGLDNLVREPLATICHGDAYNNNMMFKYGEDGSPASLILLDLQIMHYGLPTRDLGYYFLMSTSGELRRNHLDELFHYYLQHLFNSLDILGVTEISRNDFSFEKLKEMYYKETIHTGFMQSMSCLPYLLLEQEHMVDIKEMDPNEMSSDDPEIVKKVEEKYGKHMLGNSSTIERVCDVMKEMVSEGVFD